MGARAEVLVRAANHLTAEQIEKKFPNLPLVQADVLDAVGAAYVFEYLHGTWSEIQRLQADDLGPNQDFGASVAIDARLPRSLLLTVPSRNKRCPPAPKKRISRTFRSG